MNQYTFPMCIQLTVPDNLRQPEFLEILELLEKNGFYGVELNLTDFEQYAPGDIKMLLASYHLKMTMIATGVYAKQRGLSLSDSDEKARMRSVGELANIIKYASEAEAGVICGFIKGPAVNGCSAVTRLKKSLTDIDDLVLKAKIPFLLEATNHYESSVANTVGGTVELLEKFHNPWFQVLPDTYHMNIEEKDWAMALCKYREHYHSVHISDNNRRFPGAGAIDFSHIFSVLAGLDYDGLVAVEGEAGGDLKEGIIRTGEYLREISRKLDDRDLAMEA